MNFSVIDVLVRTHKTEPSIFSFHQVGQSWVVDSTTYEHTRPLLLFRDVSDMMAYDVGE